MAVRREFWSKDDFGDDDAEDWVSTPAVLSSRASLTVAASTQ